MEEFDSLDRCAAYVAARGALEALQRTVPAWPHELGNEARGAAADVVVMTAQSLGYSHATPGRRRHVRAAIARAIELAATCEVAGALGEDVDELQRSTGRAIALLGMLFHASASPCIEDDDGEDSSDQRVASPPLAATGRIRKVSSR